MISSPHRGYSKFIGKEKFDVLLSALPIILFSLQALSGEVCLPDLRSERTDRLKSVGR